MTLILKDRVKETTATVGLGTISLGGSSDTFEPFSTIGTGNTTYYAIVAEGNDNWEVGVGTVGSGTLSRDIVLASSNSNAKVNFPAGTKDVFVTLPANKIVSKDDATGINSGISLADYVDFDTAAAPATAVGRLFWNDQDGTLDLGLKGGSVTIHIGQKQVIRIVNKIGSSLSAANYQCVKISGAQGQRPKVALAQANNDANSADTIGLVNETIANNQEGFVCTGGTITNINTTGSLQGESWNDGDVLYLSGTVAGQLTNVRPQAPIHTVIVGFVIYAHANQGKIFVKVDNGYELDELHNVNITSPSNGQVLTYNNGLWENQTNGSGTVTSVSGTGGYGGLTLTGTVTSSGNLTLGGTPTGTWPVSVSGNAATVTNGVYTTGDQTIGGTKTFSNAIAGSITGNASTVTNGVYTTGDQTIAGNKTFSSAIIGSITGNADTVDGYNIQVDGTGTNPNTIYFKTEGGVDPSAAIWGDITGSIVDQTDLYNALVNGTYATGNWNINAESVDGYSVQVDGTGTDPNTIYFKTTGGTISVDWDDVANTPTTVSGYGITDAVTTSGNQTIGGTKTFSSTITGSITGNADTVDGYNVQVDGTGTDPNTIYFKTTGGSISVEWDDVSNTPTTVSGYGITDAVTTSGNQTVGGTKTFSSTITGSITGNAGTVTNGVYTSGDQTIGGTKTFSSTISGSIDGNSNTVDGYHVQVDGTGTDPNTIYFKTTGGGIGVDWDDISNTPTTVAGYGITDAVTTSGNQTIGGTKTFSSTITGSITGNAGTVTNGVYTTGDQTIAGIKTFSGASTIVGGNFNLSGGTANGVAYLNGSKNLTTGSALTFSQSGGAFSTTFNINSLLGSATYKGGIVITEDESAFTLYGGSNYKLLETQGYSTPNALKFYANNTEQMRLTSTGLGIGTSSPWEKISVPFNNGIALGSSTYSFKIQRSSTGELITTFSDTYDASTARIDFTMRSGHAAQNTPLSILGSGNVGIGTTSPGRRLSIAGGGFAFDDANVSTRSIHWGNGTTYPVLIQGDATNGFITFNTHASGSGPPERMRIDSSGKVLVGAGATASLGKLVVSEASSGTAVIALESQGSWNSQISSTSTGNMIFSNGTNERLKIDSSGNVTASVSMLAPIYYDSNNTGYYLDPTSLYSLRTVGDWRSNSDAWTGEFAGKIQYHNNTWYFQATNGWIFRNASAVDVATISNAGDLTLNGQLIVNSGDGSSYIYMADTDEGARVIHCNSNRIGFLTQAGGWGSYCVDEGDWISDMSVRAPIFYDTNNTAFYVNPNDTSNINNLVMNGFIQGRSCADTNVNTANDTGSISIRGSSTTVAAMSFHRTGAYAINMGLGTDNVFRIGGWSASNNCLQMDGSGNLTMLNNVTAYSDARLKTDVVKIENALDKVQQLNGYTYTRTDTGSKQTGVIAQEVMKVLPEVVMGSEDTHYSVAYGNMVGLLIEAIKEQQGQINELKLTIEQLKGN